MAVQNKGSEAFKSRKKNYPQAVMMFGSKNDHFKECCPQKNFGYGKDYPLAFKLIMSHGFVC